MEKKRILYLAFRFPFPLTDGYRLRVYNYCKCLKNIGYKVDLLFIYEDEREYISFLKEVKDTFENIIPIKLSKFEKIKNLLISLLKFESLQENIFLTFKGKKYAQKNYKNYDKIFISYIRMYKYVDNLQCYKVLDYTDSLAYHYDKARYEAHGIWKLIYNYEFKKIKKLEKNLLEKIDKALITSPMDKEYILSDIVNPKSEIEIFSQAINEKLFSYTENIEKNRNKKIIVFIGKLDYYPNEDAVLYFSKEVLPKLNNVEFQVIGINATEKIKKLEDENSNIKILGFLEDPYQFIKNADLMVAPIRIGGGIQNKILEGMALGKTVITFEQRIKPMVNIKNYEEIIGVKNTEEFIEIINKLTEKDLEGIGIKAQEFIKNNYTWKIIEKKLKEYLN